MKERKKERKKEGLNTSPTQRLFRRSVIDSAVDTYLKDQRRLDAGNIVCIQPRRTGERVWKETTVTGERDREWKEATKEGVIHNVTVHCHRIKDERLQLVRNETATDATLTRLGEMILNGWPDHRADTEMVLVPYYRDELTIQDVIIYRGERIVILQDL